MLLLFSNCRKNDDFLFEMEYINDFTITAGLNPFAGIHIFETSNIPTNSLPIFSQNGVTEEDLSAINPGTAFMQGIFTDTDNGYIQEVSVKIFNPDDPTVEREIFYRTQVPENSSGNLALIGTLVNAKDFLKNEEFGIRVEFRLRDISPESVDMRLDFSFFAK